MMTVVLASFNIILMKLNSMTKNKSNRYDGTYRYQKDIIIHPTMPSVHEWHYRNKMQFPIGRSKKEGIIVGCYAHSSHNIINTENCHIQKHTNNVIANAVREMATKFN